MASVAERTAPYTNFLINPLPASQACRVCHTFCDARYPTCYPCAQSPEHADGVLPISYSPRFGQLHTALRSYKGAHRPTARKFSLDLAAVLWRFLGGHERCLANSVGLGSFDLVTTVPAGTAHRDAIHPLRWLVAQTVGPTIHRYERLLHRTEAEAAPRRVNLDRFEPSRRLHGESILLLDDTWTTGSSVQSAAGALKDAGAGPVGVVVIGRHVNPDWRDHGRLLRELAGRFDWEACALEA